MSSPVREIRRKLGLSQAELAKALDISQGAVSHFERGCSPSADTAKKIVAIARKAGVDVTMDWIYGIERL